MIDNWVVVDTFTPCSTNPPYDYRGMRHVRQLGKVLTSAGIVYDTQIIARKKENFIGSGPGGAIRLGDDMLPSIYRILVPERDLVDAILALADHEAKVQLWLSGNAPMPEAYK